MSFQLADLFIQVSVRGVKATQNSIGTLRAQLGEFSPLIGGLQLASAAWLATLAFGNGMMVKEFIEAENATMSLSAALENVHIHGKDAQEWATRFATDLQSQTVLSAHAIEGLMATALRLGASIKDVQTITKAGIGLGEMYFNGDAQAGVQALTLAQQGNYRQLQRMIPELKSAHSRQEALNMVMEKARQGLEFAYERTNTFGGALSRMKVAVDNAAESFGKLLIPYLRQVTEFIQKAAYLVENLSEAQKMLALRIMAVSAAIAAVIMFGPPLLAFFGAVATAAVAMVRIISASFVFLISNPIGWFIAALAGAAIAVAYLAGEGEKTTDRIASGFVKIAEFMDPIVGSFQGLGVAIKMVWSQVISYIVDAMIGLRTMMISAWETMCEGIEQIWWAMFLQLNQGWELMKSGAKSAMAWLVSAWEATTDTIANKLAYAMQRVEVTSEYREKHPEASDREVYDAVSKEMAIRKAYLDKQTSDAKSAHQKEYQDKINHIGDEYQANKEYMLKQIEDQAKADRDKREGNRAANDAQGQADIEANRKQREADWNDGMNRLKSMPKLSTAIKELYNKIKAGLGIEQLEKELQALFAKFEALKTDPGDLRAGNQNMKLGDQSTSAPHMTSLSEAFKKAQVEAMIGHELADRDREERRRAEAERHKQHNTTNRHLSAMSDKMDNLGLAGAMV